MIKTGNVPPDMSGEEIGEYKRYMMQKHPEINVGTLNVTIDGDDVELELVSDRIIPFQRIRRITGYLTGTVDRWNNAKKAELEDRVKHGIGGYK